MERIPNLKRDAEKEELEDTIRDARAAIDSLRGSSDTQKEGAVPSTKRYGRGSLGSRIKTPDTTPTATPEDSVKKAGKYFELAKRQGVRLNAQVDKRNSDASRAYVPSSADADPKETSKIEESTVDVSGSTPEIADATIDTMKESTSPQYSEEELAKLATRTKSDAGFIRKGAGYVNTENDPRLDIDPTSVRKPRQKKAAFTESPEQAVAESPEVKEAHAKALAGAEKLVQLESILPLLNPATVKD
ncbi:MAG: hypothetical protein ACREGC_02840, partial [Minisyncoccia bacterium]